MDSRISIPLVLIATLCLTVVARAQDDADVRRELEAQYQKLAEAHDRKDLKAIVALKTADFHSIFPDGRIGDSKLMEQYSKDFLDRNQPPFDMRFTIQKLTVSFNKLIAVAEVLQELTRYQDLAGKRRKVDTSVVQRETWAKTTDGWKLKSVDNVRDQKRFVDGRRVDPTKAFDPDDPPYKPDDAGTMPSAETPYKKIYLSKAGQIFLDGKSVTLAELDGSLVSLAQQHGVVLYSREAPQEKDPHPVFKQVLDLVIKNRLPVRLCFKPDCSDALTADGKLRIDK